MAAERRVLLLLSGLFSLVLQAQGLLQRKVTVEAQQVRLSLALSLVAQEAGFKLSYNAAAVPVDSIVSIQVVDRTAERVLTDLLGPGMVVRESGQHVIIVGGTGAKRPFQVQGQVLDAATGAPVARATVYEVRLKHRAQSDGAGRFELQVSGTEDRTALLVARAGYQDTVVHVGRDGDLGRVLLSPRPKLEYLEPRCVTDLCGVEATGVGRLLLSAEQVDQAKNLGFIGKRVAQLSVVPNVGTNGPFSGAYVNHASFNVIGGYARGLEGFEVGGVFNMERRDVLGVQLAGGANLVGGNTRGLQLAGAVNHTQGSLQGVQIAGAFNTVWDTLSGVQVAGAVNMVRGSMKGTQVSGGLNLAMGHMAGTQVSGGANITLGEVHKGQFAFGLNYARHVEGGQFACGANVVPGVVGGGQVAFGLNLARSVDGGQFAMGLNAVPGRVTGGQVAFGMNYAHEVHGGQFAFGMNAVPGQVNGGQVVFGMNYAHRVEGGQFALGANVVSGHVTKGQFACGLNYAPQASGGQVALGLNVSSGTVRGGQVAPMNVARRCEGGQVGLLNIADTITGTPIGLLSIARSGYHRVDLGGNDVTPLELSVRTGVRHFYNILSVAAPVADGGRWAFGYGFGSEPRLGARTFLAIELTADQVQEQPQWRSQLQLLSRFRTAFGVELAPDLMLHAGPVMQLLISDARDAEGRHTTTLPPNALWYDQVDGRMRLAGWWGFRAGLGWRF